MKFKIRTSGCFYPNKEEREELEKLGFVFVPSDYKGFKIQGDPTIEMNTLDELVEFSNKWGEIVISGQTIEIYDNYRE